MSTATAVGSSTILIAAALLWARETPLLWPSEASITRKRPPLSAGAWSSLKVKASLVHTMVALEGDSTPTREGGVTMTWPPQVTTQKLRRVNRFDPEILALVPRTERPS